MGLRRRRIQVRGLERKRVGHAESNNQTFKDIMAKDMMALWLKVYSRFTSGTGISSR